MSTEILVWLVLSNMAALAIYSVLLYWLVVRLASDMDRSVQTHVDRLHIWIKQRLDAQATSPMAPRHPWSKDALIRVPEDLVLMNPFYKGWKETEASDEVAGQDHD